ncbi:MAG: hypothetical protein OEY18_17135 [Candidatus Aminicenantes bacterium]|nr:hypothetical protein [Candidatus Aminicenantes bacterium]
MKVALAQICPKLGDIRKNFHMHIDCIQKAKRKKADLLIFPELSLTGYTLKDMVEEVALQPRTNPLFKQFKTLSRNISFVVGFVEEKEKGLFLNSAAFFSQGKILHIHRKVFLPTYGMFEELKFFGQGINFTSFPTPFGKAGMMICYDFLHFGSSYLLFVGGSELIIVISAAPGRGFVDDASYASSRMWELMGEAISLFPRPLSSTATEWDTRMENLLPAAHSYTILVGSSSPSHSMWMRTFWLKRSTSKISADSGKNAPTEETKSQRSSARH